MGQEPGLFFIELVLNPAPPSIFEMVLVTGFCYMILFQEVSISKYNDLSPCFLSCAPPPQDCSRIPDAWVADDGGVNSVRWCENYTLNCFQKQVYQ